MNPDISNYNQSQSIAERDICDRLAAIIDDGLPDAESKIWHAHPVWFLEGNPIVGYSKMKGGIRLMFWSGVSFEEEKLRPSTGKFKDASIMFTAAEQISREEMARWLEKGKHIQWDYKNVVKSKGVLERLK
ncbi:MAG: DUF1801 domain-containing protein [Chitinophagales bacterium]|nr:DUF1801 domain-containing protein [Chitinophagales bacterium]